MKVLLINGSPHEKGNTYIALSEVAKTLNEEGIDTEIEWIGVKAIHGCIVCGHCNEAGRCVFDDDPCNRICGKAAEADGFVFGSPVYYGQPNGSLLSLVQRMLFSRGENLTDKPVANVAVCRRGGASAAYQMMNMPFEMVCMPIITSQYWNIAYGRAPGEASRDEEGMQTMRTLARNMARTLRGYKVNPPPEREPGVMTNFIR